MMSNSNDETLHNIKQTTPSKVRFADEAGPPNVSQNTTTTSTPGADTTKLTVTPQPDYLYTNSFNFALSKIFSRNQQGTFNIKNCNFGRGQKLHQHRQRRMLQANNAYIHRYWKNLQVINGFVCVNNSIAVSHTIMDAYIETIHATLPGSWGRMEMAFHGPVVRNGQVQSLRKDW